MIILLPAIRGLWSLFLVAVAASGERKSAADGDGKASASRNADKGGKRPAFRAELAHLRELMRVLDAEQQEGQ